MVVVEGVEVEEVVEGVVDGVVDGVVEGVVLGVVILVVDGVVCITEQHDFGQYSPILIVM